MRTPLFRGAFLVAVVATPVAFAVSPKNVTYTPRTDEYTLAFQFKPVK